MIFSYLFRFRASTEAVFPIKENGVGESGNFCKKTLNTPFTSHPIRDIKLIC